MPSTLRHINIEVQERNSLDDTLNAAVRDLQTVAKLSGTLGIIVTRNGPGSYTAELTEKVPYGITREVIL
ncbi:hypothetical protein PV772_18995 [Pseudarthrobacter sp. CC12]|uniref:hypothetical protein n=1 Tax=Pseudarthrobacter sp. CC12 TaxID=3029193 RepID=UPI0032632009